LYNLEIGPKPNYFNDFTQIISICKAENQSEILPPAANTARQGIFFRRLSVVNVNIPPLPIPGESN